MSAVLFIGLAAIAWLCVALPLGGVIGLVIRAADRRHARLVEAPTEPLFTVAELADYLTARDAA